MPFFNSIPLCLVIVQLVQLGLAEGEAEAEAETESIREREEGERGKKKPKKKKIAVPSALYLPPKAPMSGLKSGHQMKLVAGRARR